MPQEARLALGLLFSIALLTVPGVASVAESYSPAGTYSNDSNAIVEAGPDSRPPVRGQASPFSFAITADMREYAGSGLWDTSQYFRGATEAIAGLGGTAFMVSPGDIDPPADVFWTVEEYLAPGYLWYPVVGNHEKETPPPDDMVWLRAYDYDANGGTPPNIVNAGPSSCSETTFSFDYENVHFVVLNEYCSDTSDTGTDGDIVDFLYDWLSSDLQATNMQHIFVIGHEPGYPQPDADNERFRHGDDSLNAHASNRDRFWNLLKAYDVVAYVCGHTHNFSVAKIEGVWQMDAGHSRGLGDTGAASTFIIVHVNIGDITFEAYRDDSLGGAYTLAHSGDLWELPPWAYLPLVGVDAVW